jgi:hypothetical protein
MERPQTGHVVSVIAEATLVAGRHWRNRRRDRHGRENRAIAGSAEFLQAA